MSSASGEGKARILVVDDEVGIRDMVCDALRLSGYEVLEAIDGSTALGLMARETVDLIICDINMPGMDGYETLTHLRERGNTTPMIMLTARQEKEDVRKAYSLGTDDYVRKPFSLEELILKTEAMLRRANQAAAPTGAVLNCGPIVLNDDTHEVTLNGAQVELSPTEFDLLRILMENKGKVLSRAKLLSEVWDINFDTGTNVVDTYISYLRKKLHTSDFAGIRTVRGVGFQISDKK
jgi:two-component system, OmpR family, response regulator